MTRSEFTSLVHFLADAWAQRDFTRAAGVFAEGVRYADPTRYSFHGRDQLLAFFQADEGYAQRTAWHNIVFDEEQQVGAAEYTYDGTHRYHGVTLVKVAAGKITHWREYQHIDPRPWTEFASDTIWQSPRA